MDFTRSRNQNRPSSRLAIPLRRERFPLMDLDALDEEVERAAAAKAQQEVVLAQLTPVSMAAPPWHESAAAGAVAGPAAQAVESPQAESIVAVSHPEPQPAITRRLPRALPARARAAKAKTA